MEDTLSRLAVAFDLAGKKAPRHITPWASLEELLTSPRFFGLDASPLQRAICRITEGRPLEDLAANPAVVKALGNPALLPRERPDEMVVISGIRVGKSLIAAAVGVDASQRVDVSRLGPGEIPRFSIVSLSRDLADVVRDHIVGRIMASEELKKLLVAEPKGDGVLLRHPSGRTIELLVVAGARAGASLVARWSAGAVFDEFPRMVGGGEGVINWDDSRRAVLERRLPNAQLWHIGAPWAPFGPGFRLVTDYWGRPSRSLVLVKAPAWDMNPNHWTPERIEKAKSDPDVYQTDVAAEFATPSEAMFSSASLDAVTRLQPLELPPEKGLEYCAAIDPATRSNGWTLSIATKKGGKRVQVLAREWRGSAVAPLDPDKVLAEIAGILKPYGIDSILSDQWSSDALRSLAGHHGLSLIQKTSTAEQTWTRYRAFGLRLTAGEVELAPHAQCKADLQRVQKRVLARGSAVHLPRTSDGRHCDFAPAVVLSFSRWLEEPVAPVEKSELERLHEEQTRMRREAESAFRGPQRYWG